MLTDREIEDAAKKLAEFRAKSAEEDFLQRYADLLTSYRQLKSDFEEEKLTRERYKQLARNQERNPFVLVIVDGDGYIFKDEFLHKGADGGSQAAQHLYKVVKTSLRGKGLDNCEVMIRVYANLANLSRTLSKNGLATADKRSLSPFVANFNRSYGLVDFVDAGELKENADFKIRALLGLYAENAQCKHIYFAACHDVGYLSELTRFRGDRNRVTLIRSSGLLFHTQFLKLDLGVEELPGVFRTVPLDAPTPYPKSSLNTDLKSPPPSGPSATSNTTHSGGGTWDSQKICQFYQSGKCRFGGDCKNAHVDARASKSFPYHTNNHGSYDNEIASGPGRVKPSATASLYELDNTSPGGVSARSDPATQLPRKGDIPDGYVAVNKNLQRLDAYMLPPSPAATSKLRELSSATKFCNSKQLTNSCPNENCEYEHNPLPDELLPALEWLSRSLPCAKRGGCRTSSCVLGHICQNMECQYRGGKIKCKLPANAHTDLVPDQFVPDPNYIEPTNMSNATNSPATVTSHSSGLMNQTPGVDALDLS
ncbi:hypothetical protein O1611_g2242 [Lasiodiplodia mahajangana]|uniref:Uncharacterized protein n=1 Tax=Lasiodiplodia mahajangana TaxID=1108764 RepID=A0ACC2JVG1_9PEZI|nr:hypothetical protein O1611_g2242 [Lasiodiplodia mahajangana]